MTVLGGDLLFSTASLHKVRVCGDRREISGTPSQIEPNYDTCGAILTAINASTPTMIYIRSRMTPSPTCSVAHLVWPKWYSLCLSLRIWELGAQPQLRRHRYVISPLNIPWPVLWSIHLHPYKWYDDREHRCNRPTESLSFLTSSLRPIPPLLYF